jgi:hypothetical protein
MWDVRERTNPNPVKSPGTISTPNLLQGASLSQYTFCVCGP